MAPSPSAGLTASPLASFRTTAATPISPRTSARIFIGSSPAPIIVLGTSTPFCSYFRRRSLRSL